MLEKIINAAKMLVGENFRSHFLCYNGPQLVEMLIPEEEEFESFIIPLKEKIEEVVQIKGVNRVYGVFNKNFQDIGRGVLIIEIQKYHIVAVRLVPLEEGCEKEIVALESQKDIFPYIREIQQIL